MLKHTLTEDGKSSNLTYVPPKFELHSLQLITLGGSPGVADSGDAGEGSPFGEKPPGGGSTPGLWDDAGNNTCESWDDSCF